MWTGSLRCAWALRALVLLGALPAVVGSAAALAPLQQPAAAKEVAWVEGRLDAVLARAKQRNVPIVIFACIADEVHNEEFRRALAGNASLAKGLEGAIAMYASSGEPPPGAKLAKHKELMDEVYNRFIAEATPDGSWPLPDVLVVKPDGALATRLGSGHTVSDKEILDALAKVSKELGQGVDDATVERLEALRAAGRAAKLAGNAHEEWRSWRGILALTDAGPFVKEAQDALPLADTALQAVLKAALEGVDESTAARRYALLRDVMRRGRGTELEKSAAKLRATLERDKRFKAILSAAALEEDAEDLLFDAEVALARRETARAQKLFKQLAGKKFNPTGAANRARAAHPSWMEG